MSSGPTIAFFRGLVLSYAVLSMNLGLPMSTRATMVDHMGLRSVSCAQSLCRKRSFLSGPGVSGGSAGCARADAGSARRSLEEQLLLSVRLLGLRSRSSWVASSGEGSVLGMGCFSRSVDEDRRSRDRKNVSYVRGCRPIRWWSRGSMPSKKNGVHLNCAVIRQARR